MNHKSGLKARLRQPGLILVHGVVKNAGSKPE